MTKRLAGRRRTHQSGVLGRFEEGASNTATCAGYKASDSMPSTAWKSQRLKLGKIEGRHRLTENGSFDVPDCSLSAQRSSLRRLTREGHRPSGEHDWRPLSVRRTLTGTVSNWDWQHWGNLSETWWNVYGLFRAYIFTILNWRCWDGALSNCFKGRACNTEGNSVLRNR